MTLDLDALQRISERSGIPVEELVVVARGEHTPVPTVSEFLSRVEEAATPGARRTYATYWRRLAEAYGDRPIDRVTTTDLRILTRRIQETAERRRFADSGISAAEHFVSATRLFFRVAEEDGLVAGNPAAKLEKPRRPEPARRPLTEPELTQLVDAVRNTTDDPDLDLLLVRFHLETGARREGALGLTLERIDPDRQTIWLVEKYGRRREQPVTRTLVDQLCGLAETQGATRADDRVFLYAAKGSSGFRPITKNRYATIFRRAAPYLPFAATTRLGSHTLRATAITLVERAAGGEVARAFAGHAPSTVTSMYTKASLGEVARAVSLLWGEPHPLAGG